MAKFLFLLVSSILVVSTSYADSYDPFIRALQPNHRSRRDIFDFFGGIVSGVVDTAGAVVGGVADTVNNVVNGVADATGQVVSGVANATGDAVNNVANATGNIVSGTGDLIGGVVDGVTGAVGGAIGVVTGAGDLLNTVLSLPEIIENILKSLTTALFLIEIIINVVYALGNLFVGNVLAVVVYVVNIIAGLLTFPW